MKNDNVNKKKEKKRLSFHHKLNRFYSMHQQLSMGK